MLEWLVNDEVERMWKEAFVLCSQVISIICVDREEIQHTSHYSWFLAKI
jgi:hypothetical protein